MSTEVMEALENGELDPMVYWARHVSSWTNIEEATPLDDVEILYRELKENAQDVVEFLAFATTA